VSDDISVIRNSFHILGSARKKARILSYVSKQHFVPKTKLNIGICAFFVALPTNVESIPYHN